MMRDPPVQKISAKTWYVSALNLEFTNTRPVTPLQMGLVQFFPEH